MRYVLDTNVIVAALRSRVGASNAVLRRALQGQLPLVTHQKLVFEYGDVLGRSATLAGTGITRDDAQVVLAQLVAVADEVDVRYLWRPNLRDEGDNFIVEIAVAAWPCSIVTHNLGDFVRADLRFPHIAVLSPGQLMAALSSLPGGRS